ncbi:MAG: RidA family protein [Ferrimonas sp.]
MKFISTEQAPAAVGPYSQAIEVNGFLYASGQLPLVPETMQFPSDDVYEQAQQALKNVAAILAEAGMSLNNVVKATVFLDDLADFATMNTAYVEAFGDHKPARSCFQVAALPLGAKVEIEVVAAK